MSNNRAVGVLLGNGDGTFQPVVTYDSGGYGASSVAVADLNGDGKLDVIATNQNSGTIGVLLGNGDGTFQTAVTYSAGGGPTYSAVIADVNQDGKPDLVVANAEGTGTNAGGPGVLLGNGDGTFRPGVTFDSGGYYAPSVAVADLNGDGKRDLVAANECAITNGTINCNSGTVGVLINTSTPPYKAFVQQPINADGSSVFSAKRGVVPVKFTLTINNVPTCTLPAATIAVTRTAGGTVGSVDESTYSMAADNGSNFRIDSADCQYIYNLAASSLGVGTYRVDISIDGLVVGSAVFALQ